MHAFINSPLQIGSLNLPHRLIQGPLAGYSCAPFRALFHQFRPPAYAVSEMISAQDVVSRHQVSSRYLQRAAAEKLLAYQISGTEPMIMAQAAQKLEALGANIIDINCGCPKTKIRKKGAGSALLDVPETLLRIVDSVRQTIRVPLTIKMRIQEQEKDIWLIQSLANAGVDALIIHGRKWTDDYTRPVNYAWLAQLKQHVSIPVIANGDISDAPSLEQAFKESQCDGFMIARAGTGNPWLYQQLLQQERLIISLKQRLDFFLIHLNELSILENEFKAVLQSKSLVRYYFRQELTGTQLQEFYQLSSLDTIARFLEQTLRQLSTY
ncbi:MAG: tRNA-dihydrouridine synthase family protein [Legionella sp.]|nr:tRNA-dihydrouridine synthase family protein [Legionella sp.]